jgi:hypothetical protein
MAEQNIVDLSFDISKFNAQKQEIYQGLIDIYEKSKQISGNMIAVGSGGGWTELTAKVKAQEQAINDLQAANLKYATTQQTVAAAQSQAATATQQSIAATTQETRSLAENIEQRRRLQNTTASMIKDQKEDIALKKAGVITQAELTKRTNENNIAIERNKLQIASLNKEIKDEIKSTIQATGAYGLLTKAYAAAQLQAKNLAAEQGVESVAAKAAAKDASVLAERLLTIDKTVGQSQRNVGNYVGGIKDAFGALRTLANILPGIGIGGIFLAGYEVIKSLITATGDLSEKQKTLNEVYESAGKIAASDVAKFTIFKEKLTDLNVSQAERIKFAIEYNKVADDANKINLQEINNITAINDLITKEIALIEKRALAKAAESKLDEQAQKVIEAQLALAPLEKYKDVKALTQKQIRDADKIDQQEQKQNNIVNQKNNSDNLVQRSQYLKTTVELNANALDGQKKYVAAKRKLDEEQAELDRQAALLSPLITNDGLSAQGKGSQGQATGKQLQALKEKYSSEFEVYKVFQEGLIKFYDNQLKDDKIYYLDKLDILDRYTQAKLELAQRQEDDDIRKAEADKNREIQRLNEEKKGKDPAQIRRLNENIAIEQQNFQQKLNLIYAKGTQAQQDILTDDAAKKIEINLKYQDQVIKDAEEFHKQMEALQKSEDDRIAKGFAKREKAEKDAADAGIKAEKTLQEEKSRLKQKEIELAKAAFNIFIQLADRQKELQIQRLQTQIDKNNEVKNNEIANINASTISAQEKAALLEQIDITTSARNEQLARKQEELKKKEARINALAKVAEIAGNTAAGVVALEVKQAEAVAQAAVLASNPLTAAFAPLAVAAAATIGTEIAFVIGIGAAQAVAAAIPAFGEGTDSAPGGLAIVGEKKQGGGYEPELVQSAGRTFITDGPMLTTLAKGAKVTPLGSRAVFDGMATGSAAAIAYGLMLADNRGDDRKLDAIRDAVYETGRMTAGAIRKQRGGVTVNLSSEFGNYISKVVRN